MAEDRTLYKKDNESELVQLIHVSKNWTDEIHEKLSLLTFARKDWRKEQ